MASRTIKLPRIKVKTTLPKVPQIKVTSLRKLYKGLSKTPKLPKIKIVYPKI